MNWHRQSFVVWILSCRDGWSASCQSLQLASWPLLGASLAYQNEDWPAAGLSSWAEGCWGFSWWVWQLFASRWGPSAVGDRHLLAHPLQSFWAQFEAGPWWRKAGKYYYDHRLVSAGFDRHHTCLYRLSEQTPARIGLQSLCKDLPPSKLRDMKWFCFLVSGHRWQIAPYFR